MALRDVLLALGAGAGRQAEIGGLMFQDAQKREARDYEYALEKEKWRRSGDLKALDNARGAYKFKAERMYALASKSYTAYVNAKRGVGVGGELDLYGGEAKYTEEDIAKFKLDYEQYMDQGNQAMKNFMRYSGLEEEYTPAPIEDLDKLISEGTTATGAASEGGLLGSARYAVDSLEKDSPATIRTISRQMREGDDSGLTELIDALNERREAAHVNKREAAKLQRIPSDPDWKQKTHLSESQEKKVREFLKSLITDRASMTSWEENRGPPPQLDPTGQTFSQLDQNIRRDEIIASGFGDEIEGKDAYNQAIAKQAEIVEGTGTTPDPLTQMAEQLAVDNAEQAARVRDTPPRQGKGMISQTQYKKAYTEAQQTLTQMFQQFGNVTLEQFQALIAEQGLRGIELMAYRQAYKDLVGQKPTGLGFESGGLQERINTGGSIPSLSNVLFP